MAAETSTTKSNHNTERRLLIIAFAVLLIALLLQIVIAQRENLAKNSTYRPMISQLCVLAKCQLSIWRNPEAFLPIQHSVVADATQNGVLNVRLSFKNSADWPQPWPQLELALTDINGQIIGLRRFLPAEYLNSVHATDIQAEQTVSIELAIQETASKAVGFQFNFY